MNDDKKSSEHMTSQELAQATKKHRDSADRLIAEVQHRRAEMLRDKPDAILPKDK